MLDLRQRLDQTTRFLRARSSERPEVALILGSGLGPLAERIQDPVVIPYEEIPHFARSTVEGHGGVLVFGTLGGRRVVALKGRFHLYEGWSPQDCVYPVQVFHRLGAQALLVSNAAGGVNRNFQEGDLMMLDDVINFMFQNPLIGANDEAVGPRFPDMSELFSPRLQKLALEVARDRKVPLRRGTYWANSGPTYETRAELRWMGQMGADAVGMSTVPEVIAATHIGFPEVLGISCITNMATGETVAHPNHDEVMEVAKRVEKGFCELVEGILERFDEGRPPVPELAALPDEGAGETPASAHPSPTAPSIQAQLEETLAVIRDRSDLVPEVALILGSGLGPLAERIQNPEVFDFEDLPHFGRSTVQGHAGQLILGDLFGKKVVALKGRLHLYEGHSPQTATYPVRVFRALGAKTLVISNATGGLNRHYQVGDLMVMEDQINFTFLNPLIGPNDPKLGPRFVDMSQPFSPRLRELARKVAREREVPLHQGIYAGVVGPNFESMAELRMLARGGADAVGMSVIHEVIVAQHAGFEDILAVSCITDLATGEDTHPVSHEKVLAAAKAAEGHFCNLVEGVLEGF